MEVLRGRGRGGASHVPCRGRQERTLQVLGQGRRKAVRQGADDDGGVRARTILCAPRQLAAQYQMAVPVPV